MNQDLRGKSRSPVPAHPQRCLTPVPADQANEVSRMAWDIWTRHYYPDILSLPEIRQLWDRAYRPELIATEIDRGASYRWIQLGQTRAGFVAWRPDSVAGRLWLSKLYVVPEYHGTGLGAYALEQVDCAARAMSRHEIRLYVFKKNDRAIRAYLRAGYVVETEEVSDAGNGFVYDDYVMRKTIEPVSRPDAPPAANTE